jgi:hypothetical protein
MKYWKWLYLRTCSLSEQDMISCYIPEFPSIVRVHLEKGNILSTAGEQDIFLVGLVAEYQVPGPMRDDFGFISFTQMCNTAYSQN